MAGLQLIASYGSESEDDEEDTKVIKKPCLPLPQSISEWKGVSHHEEVVDDPSDHQGRVRTFKHERGNWATLIYADYVSEDSMRAWMEELKLILPVEANLINEDLHVSLTRTLILQYHWMESFVKSIKDLCSRTRRFALELSELKIYLNEERSRTFLGVHCTNSDRTLDNFMVELDKILAEYNLPPFYDDPSYHFSFMWFLGDVEATLREALPDLTKCFNAYITEHSDDIFLRIDTLFCKTGNKLYNFQLK